MEKMLVRKIDPAPRFTENCFVDTKYYRNGTYNIWDKIAVKGAVSFLTRFSSKEIHTIASEIQKCIARGKNAWNYSNGRKLIRFACKNLWFRNLLSAGLKNIQNGTREGNPVTTTGPVTPKVRIDKPWGWELILTTVREKTGSVEEGYTEKYLIVVGPLSNQKHTTKVETQTSYGPSPYLTRIGGGISREEIFEILPGGIFHNAKETWHQPSVRPGDLAIVKETSKPTIGPGSTTRDPNGDPWQEYRTRNDV